MGRTPLRAGLLVVALVATGCYAGPTVVAHQGESEAPALARVTLREVDGDILKFDVVNLSSEHMVIQRDEVILSSRLGTQRRLPGGTTRLYTLPPGGGHDLNVRFDFTQFSAGEPLEIRFERALLVGGKPISIPPIAVSVR